jgi:hypothetical protein
MSAYSNVKTITKSSVTGKETMQHHPIRTEITYPGSGKIEKTKTA